MIVTGIQITIRIHMKDSKVANVRHHRSHMGGYESVVVDLGVRIIRACMAGTMMNRNSHFLFTSLLYMFVNVAATRLSYRWSDTTLASTHQLCSSLNNSKCNTILNVRCTTRSRDNPLVCVGWWVVEVVRWSFLVSPIQRAKELHNRGEN